MNMEGSKNMKKILSILLACTFALSFATVAFAATDKDATPQAVETGSVVFKLGHGLADIEKTGAPGAEVPYPASPTVSGYTFDSWSPKSCQYPAAGTSTTVTANWTIVPGNTTVVFKLNNGAANITKSGKPGDVVEYPADPTKEGYTFDGWTVNDATFPATGSTFINALWKEKITIKVTIKFDSNGGSAVADLTGAPNDYLLPPAAPTKAGYTFIGWNLVNPDNVNPLTTAATNATTNVSPVIAYGLPARFPNVDKSTTYWYKAVWQMVDPTIATVKVAGSTEPVEAWATFIADEFQTFVDSKEVQDLIADAKTAVANGGTDGIASAVDSWVKDVADQLDIPITDVKSWLADSEIFNAFADMYITDQETTVAPTEVTDTEPVTEATTQGTIPQTGSATAGIAIFATLSLAAAAAFVCTKKR